ncbi:PEF-CTERM sorting domain-containing protein [Methanolobus zinderi]|jgi:hypothetical protein|uniref:PEF-CTERM sorting domain-containing protein n=1 Tax=Methanolobus zinderi TaxID=536044 RepID=A0A7D5EEU8_9EURY|nr:PEF-CTERM sorting domain-containing protein [Methanolobus zinderi]QLC50216.1 PEF-CTERM sorting domain-containing protein [Methanolobus zinderi]
MKKICYVLKLTVALLVVGLLVSSAGAVEYKSVEFPEGDSSFADEVISYDLRGGATGGDPGNALSSPDNEYVALGSGGSVTLKFTNNLLIASGDDNPDLCIFEYGSSSKEKVEVFISKDNENWIKVGEANKKTLIDIDTVSDVNINTGYTYVRLVDMGSTRSGKSYEGADIDAVGAISSAMPAENLPESIPEFPTIAIPVLVIVGLAFVVRRNR